LVLPASPGFTEIETAVFAGLQKSPYRFEFYSDQPGTSPCFRIVLQNPDSARNSYTNIQATKPDVIVLQQGYASLKFIAGLHDPFFADTPVISCGIIEAPGRYEKLGPHFTGVRSEPKPEETLT